MHGRSERTPGNASVFLDALARGLSATAAAEAAGIARRTAYEWREADDEFRQLWDDAIESGTDRLEDEAIRRGHDGYDITTMTTDGTGQTVHKYSDTLMILMLKGRRTAKFAERDQHAVSGQI